MTRGTGKIDSGIRALAIQGLNLGLNLQHPYKNSGLAVFAYNPNTMEYRARTIARVCLGPVKLQAQGKNLSQRMSVDSD